MKNLIYFLFAVIVAMGISSCSKKEETPQQWEYKTLAVWGNELSKFYALNIEIPQAEMDTLGARGWELVDVYTRIATVHPNFGNEKYVTGLQPNVRTLGVFYVFKRPKRNTDEKEPDVKVPVPIGEGELGDSVAS